jgi:hypothetical protein
MGDFSAIFDLGFRPHFYHSRLPQPRAALPQHFPVGGHSNKTVEYQ